MRSARGLLGRTLVPSGGCETPGSAHDQLEARCALKHAVSLRAPAGTCLRAVAPCARASRCPGRSRESATCACASRETRCHAARAEPPGRLLQPPPREPNGESHAQTRPDPRRSAYAPAGLFVLLLGGQKVNKVARQDWQSRVYHHGMHHRRSFLSALGAALRAPPTTRCRQKVSPGRSRPAGRCLCGPGSQYCRGVVDCCHGQTASNKPTALLPVRRNCPFCLPVSCALPHSPGHEGQLLRRLRTGRGPKGVGDGPNLGLKCRTWFSILRPRAQA